MKMAKPGTAASRRATAARVCVFILRLRSRSRRIATLLFLVRQLAESFGQRLAKEDVVYLRRPEVSNGRTEWSGPSEPAARARAPLLALRARVGSLDVEVSEEGLEVLAEGEFVGLQLLDLVAQLVDLGLLAGELGQ